MRRSPSEIADAREVQAQTDVYWRNADFCHQVKIQTPSGRNQSPHQYRLTRAIPAEEYQKILRRVGARNRHDISPHTGANLGVNGALLQEAFGYISPLRQDLG